MQAKTTTARRIGLALLFAVTAAPGFPVGYITAYWFTHAGYLDRLGWWWWSL